MHRRHHARFFIGQNHGNAIRRFNQKSHSWNPRHHGIALHGRPHRRDLYNRGPMHLIQPLNLEGGLFQHVALHLEHSRFYPRTQRKRQKLHTKLQIVIIMPY
jgi:hypothetical protein